MTRTTHTAVGGGLAAVALALSTLSAGAGTAPPLTLDPTSGPPGTVITVSGEDCSTKGDTWVTLELLDTEGAVQDTAEVDVDDEQPGFAGAWEATLTVPASTTDYGEWSVEATCEVRFVGVEAARAGRSVVLPAQAQSEPLFPYAPAPFTVTEPAVQPTSSTTSTSTPAGPQTAPVVAQPTYTG